MFYVSLTSKYNHRCTYNLHRKENVQKCKENIQKRKENVFTS